MQLSKSRHSHVGASNRATQLVDGANTPAARAALSKRPAADAPGTRTFRSRCSGFRSCSRRRSRVGWSATMPLVTTLDLVDRAQVAVVEDRPDAPKRLR